MILLPLKIVSSLRMNGPEKLGLAVIFLIGVISPVASTIRCATFVKVFDQGINLATLRIIEFWSAVEFTVAVLVFSLPSIRAWFVQQTRKMQGSLGTSANSSRTTPKRQRRDFMATDVSVTAYLDATGALRNEGMELGNYGSSMERLNEIVDQQQP